MTTPAVAPLHALLSHAFVAFTIELDNEFERQSPHRTARFGRTPGAGPRPWLTSFAMWTTAFRFIGPDGVSVRDLEGRSRLRTSLPGLERWGYVTVTPPASAPGARVPRSAWLVRTTPAGEAAKAAWERLVPVIEARWSERFGSEAIGRLRGSLARLVERLDPALPDGLPIVAFGFSTSLLPVRTPDGARATDGADAAAGEDAAGATGVAEPRTTSDRPLWALLARPLLALALEHEASSTLSLAMGADMLEHLEEVGLPVRELPARCGISREMVTVALSFLERRGLATIEPGSTRLARLRPAGLAARDAYRRRVAAIEARWAEAYGREVLDDVRAALVEVVGLEAAPTPTVRLGLEPHPDGWRAKAPRLAVLPDFPLVTHRGGYPDGS